MNDKFSDRIRFFLSKADTAGTESDRQRVLMQITQELCKRPGLNKCGFDMPTIFVPSLVDKVIAILSSNFYLFVVIVLKHCWFNPLTARIFTVFGHGLLEDRVLHKEAWVAKLLGTHLSVLVYKKVKSR